MADLIHEAIPLDGTAEDSPTVRAVARDVFRRAGCDEDLAGDALLCLSELVTNALLHAGGTICVELTATAATVRLEVTDGVPVLDDLEQRTGRGLAIVQQLTDGWGVVATIVDGRPGKIVWAEVVHPAVADRAGRSGHAAEAVFVDVPIRLFLASEAHHEALLKDLQLRAAEWTSRNDRELKGLAEALRRNQDARAESLEEVRRLVATGEDVVTLRFPLTDDTPARGRAFLETVATSEARTGRGAPVDGDDPSAAELRHFRRWYVAELTHQARGGSPRRCPFRP